MQQATGAAVRFTIGAMSATLVEEMVDRSFEFRRFFPLSTDAALQDNLGWMSPRHYDAHQGRLQLSMHAWLLDTGSCKILIGGCVGNGKTRPGRPDWNDLDTPFLERLAEAGARPQDIDYVLCTHLHADQIGWNTRLNRGRWVPTFPNATYVFSQREHAYWQSRLAYDRRSLHALAYQDSVLPVIEAGQALMVGDHHVLGQGIRMECAPGHTAGHMAIWVETDDGLAVFTGDILHHPMQLRDPHWSCFGCADQLQSARTRQRILEKCADTGALLLPAHFMAPHAGRVGRSGPGFELLPARDPARA